MPELTRRYIVMAMATEGPFDMQDPDAPFVLKPWKDPAALRALEAYRDHCYPELAGELGAWIKAIRSGHASRGGVGARNEPHMRSAPKAKPKAASRPKARKKPAGRKSLKKKGKRRK
ncbi:MAG TPA: hypothetical protein VJA45_02005 [Methylomirabilota bacterium]|nr:hypothetical protein [Methylomirabilota bacterium]